MKEVREKALELHAEKLFMSLVIEDVTCSLFTMPSLRHWIAEQKAFCCEICLLGIFSPASSGPNLPHLRANIIRTAYGGRPLLKGNKQQDKRRWPQAVPGELQAGHQEGFFP